MFKAQDSFPTASDINLLLEKVHSICLFGSTNKITTPLSRNSLSLFAVQKVREDLSSNSQKMLEKIEKSKLSRSHMGIYQKYLNSKNQPKNQKDRKSYLIGLIHMMLELPFRYGYSNCEALAEIAFIEAVIRNFACGIHFVNVFNQANPLVEEINTVALGDWPEPGCIIISPWENEFGTSYNWGGSCKQTQSFLDLNLEDYKTIFSICENDPYQERSFIKNLLSEMQYSQWLNDSERKINLDLIKNDFFNYVNQAKYFLEKGRGLGYREMIKMSCTSKYHYQYFKQAKATLNQDEHVKTILNMPRS